MPTPQTPSARVPSPSVQPAGAPIVGAQLAAAGLVRGTVSPPVRSHRPSSAQSASSRGATTLVVHCPSSLVRFRILSTGSALPHHGTAGLLYPEAQDVPESEGMLWRRNP